MYNENDPYNFWKNYRLGTELQISGSFLYNALYFFDKMEHFYYEEECFEFLYNVSVGFERLQKIVIVLLEHSEAVDQEVFEKSLITHNHLELLNRIKKRSDISLGKTHIKFLALISEFYKSTRYERYNLSSVYTPNQDKLKLINYIQEELKIQITSGLMGPTPINHQIKEFICKVISKIAKQLYKIIDLEAHKANMYTYEIAYSSKAFKIFIANDYTFEKEKLLKKEILLHLLNNKIDDNVFKFLKGIPPLEFESYCTDQYIKYLFDFHNERHMLEELEYLYEENKFDKERFEKTSIIGEDMNFDIPDED